MAREAARFAREKAPQFRRGLVPVLGNVAVLFDNDPSERQAGVVELFTRGLDALEGRPRRRRSVRRVRPAAGRGRVPGRGRSWAMMVDVADLFNQVEVAYNAAADAVRNRAAGE